MTTTDARGKIIRVGDSVHRVGAARAINKGEPNGRVLTPYRTYRVKSIDGYGVGLTLGKSAKGRALIKE